MFFIKKEVDPISDETKWLVVDQNDITIGICESENEAQKKANRANLAGGWIQRMP